VDKKIGNNTLDTIKSYTFITSLVEYYTLYTLESVQYILPNILLNECQNWRATQLSKKNDVCILV
jgi:hypothetical protein